MEATRFGLWPFCLAGAVLVGLCTAWQVVTPSFAGQMATADRLEEPGWWPTKGTAPREDYVGPAVCATCHASRATTQASTAMARTAQRPGDSEVLRRHDHLTFRAGRYTYEIATAQGRSRYTVTDGAQSRSAVLTWAFGMGKVGQTYFYEHDGTLYEGRVSFFDTLQALDVTPARGLPSPAGIEEAMGRPLPEAEARRCFGCHTTAASTGAGFDLEHLIPGVTCESCHGPGRTHVAAALRGGAGGPRDTIMNPASLDPAGSVDFCGACHATFWDVKLAGEQGLAAMRSQPYRLQSSPCWGEGDERLTCAACHDPHRPLARDPQAYDARCLGCHVSRGSQPSAAQPGRACRTAAANCTGCHMPKYTVPDMHFRFTDHRIQ